MDCDVITAALRKMGDKTLRFINHQVCIEHQVGMRAQVLDEFGTEGDIGHKPAIHDIEMNPLRTTCFDTFHFLGSTGKIRGKHAWCDDERSFFHTPVIAGRKRFCNVIYRNNTIYLLICFRPF
ncbi:hypothetical protein DSECCO2_593090 [anaerobic digester metagenome]